MISSRIRGNANSKYPVVPFHPSDRQNQSLLICSCGQAGTSIILKGMLRGRTPVKRNSPLSNKLHVFFDPVITLVKIYLEDTLEQI